MRMGRVPAVAAMLAVAAVFALPLTASAHALPQSAIPPEGAEVQTAPTVVEITFGEAPDSHLSSIVVVDSSGLSVAAGPTTVVPGHPLELEVPLKHIGTGVYTVTWKTVSEVDGHLATGAYAFGVGVSAANANAHASRSVVSPPPSVLAVVSRWLFFIGLIGLVGLVSTCLIALREIPGFTTRALGVMWMLAAVGVAGLAEAERAAAGVPWTAVFSTSLGTVIAERIAALAVTAAGIAVLTGRSREGATRRPPRRRGGRGGINVGRCRGESRWRTGPGGRQPPIQWVHILASGVRIGGLLALLLAVRGQPSDVKGRAVRRFSTAAGIAIVVVALTGTFRAVIEVGSISRLFGTAFGVLVIVKVVPLLALVGLGAVNRFGNVPQASRQLRGLRRAGSTEVIIGAVVLLVAAALVNVAPPVASAVAATSAQSTRLVLSGSDFATTVRVRLAVTPGSAGFNDFTLRVSNYDTGLTVRASSVQLEFTQPLRPQLGQSTLTSQAPA